MLNFDDIVNQSLGRLLIVLLLVLLVIGFVCETPFPGAGQLAVWVLKTSWTLYGDLSIIPFP